MRMTKTLEINTKEHEKSMNTHNALTKREIEILSYIIQGHSSKQVGEMLFISKRTVDFHLDNIYEKLHVSNRMQAFQQATKMGIL